MKEPNAYIRRTISISPYIDELISECARKEFSGNLSAFLAHIALHYTKCQRCTINNTVNVNEANGATGNNTVINQTAGNK